jgi:hypothetical protein
MIRTEHKKIAKALEKKGWKKEHISKIKEIMDKGEAKSEVRKGKQQMHLMLILFVMIGNALILFSLTPLMIVRPPWIYLSFIGLFAIIFGYFVDRLISEIRIALHHYIISTILIAGITAGCLFLSFQYAKKLAVSFELELVINLVALIIFYLFFFYLPHFTIRCKHGTD